MRCITRTSISVMVAATPPPGHENERPRGRAAERQVGGAGYFHSKEKVAFVGRPFVKRRGSLVVRCSPVREATQGRSTRGQEISSNSTRDARPPACALRGATVSESETGHSGATPARPAASQTRD